ncbi:MAG: glycosyltransferase family 39 protein [Candidatus Woesearchaeota archaeon]
MRSGRGRHEGIPISRQKREKLLLTAILLVFLLSIIGSQALTPVLMWDENAYLANARSHISESNYREDYRAPLLEYIIASVWYFTGESIFTARLAVSLMAVASIFLVYLITRDIFRESRDAGSGKKARREDTSGRSAGGIIDYRPTMFALIFGICPLFLFWGNKAYPNVPALFLATASFYFIMKSAMNSGEGYDDSSEASIYNPAVISGVFAGLAFLMRYTMALFAVSVFAYLIFTRRGRQLFSFAAASFLAILPWLFLNILEHGNPLHSLIYSYNQISSYTAGSYAPPIVQLQNIAGFMGILLIFLPFGLYWMCRAGRGKNDRKKKDRGRKSGRDDGGRGILLILAGHAVLFYALHLFLVSMKLARYNVEILSAMYIMAFAGIVFIDGKISGRIIARGRDPLRISFYAILLLATVSASIVHVASEYRGPESIYSMECSIYKSVKAAEDLPEDAVYASNFRPYFGYYNNLEVYSLWTDDLMELNEIYGLDYIIYSDNFGILYDEEVFDREYLDPVGEVSACGDTVRFYRIKEGGA